MFLLQGHSQVFKAFLSRGVKRGGSGGGGGLFLKFWTISEGSRKRRKGLKIVDIFRKDFVMS